VADGPYTFRIRSDQQLVPPSFARAAKLYVRLRMPHGSVFYAMLLDEDDVPDSGYAYKAVVKDIGRFDINTGLVEYGWIVENVFLPLAV
jgi:hypothetical protein